MKRTIKVAFTFTAEVEVEAASAVAAEAAVRDHFSCITPSWEKGNCDLIVGWNDSAIAQKHILRGIEHVGQRQEDGSYMVNASDMWHNITAALRRAERAERAGNLALLGLQLLEVFSQNEQVTEVSIDTSESSQYDDQGGAYLTYDTTVTVKAADEDDDDGTNVDEIADELQQSVGDDNLGKTIFESTNRSGQVVVTREDFAPFLGRQTVSGLEVIKHLASLPDTSFEDFVAKLENIHV